MRRWLVLLVVTALGLGLAAGAAAGTIDDVKKRGKLVAGVKTDFPPFGYVDAIAVRKGDTEFINWVNGQLQKMRADGTFDRLWKKYFGEVEGNLVKP